MKVLPEKKDNRSCGLGLGAGHVPLRVQPQEEVATEGASVRDLESRPAAGETVRSGGALRDTFLCVCVYMQGCLYWRLKWDCGLEGLYVYMPAIGEFGTQGQLLVRLMVSVELPQPPP